MTPATMKKAIRERVEEVRDELIALSHRIHANPELRFQEEKACAALSETLASSGLSVETGVYDLPTAFVATAGSGPLRVAVLAEYDALPAIGHACGHNIIAASAAGAGIASARVADEIGATVSVIGTPAEEGGGGKVLLLQRGAFDGYHAAMMVHPSPVDVANQTFLATQVIDVTYIGKEAHASGFPERGINAADALTIAQVAIGLLRQHIRPTDRVHGITTKGGDAPNVIPAHTTARYAVRAKTMGHLEDIRAKAARCFEAGAVATGCELRIDYRDFGYTEVRNDPDILAAYVRNAEELGRTFTDSAQMERSAGSTDMGNVSLVMPAIHPMIGVQSWPAVNHQPEFAEHCATPAGDKAVIDGAIAMAWTIADIACDPAVRERLLAADTAYSSRPIPGFLEVPT